MSPRPTKIISRSVKKISRPAKKFSSSTKKTLRPAKIAQFVKKLPKISLRLPKSRKNPLKLTESALINAESSLGGTIFGAIPAGHRREFFRFKHNIWVYHENWTSGGKPFESTITYEVKKDGVYKSPLGGKYVKITGAELDNFHRAAQAYLALVKRELYH